LELGDTRWSDEKKRKKKKRKKKKDTKVSLSHLCQHRVASTRKLFVRHALDRVEKYFRACAIIVKLDHSITRGEMTSIAFMCKSSDLHRRRFQIQTKSFSRFVDFYFRRKMIQAIESRMRSMFGEEEEYFDM